MSDHLNLSCVKRSCSLDDLNSPEQKRPDLRTEIANRLISNTSKVLRKPMFPVRPAPVRSGTSTFITKPQNVGAVVDKSVLLNIFVYLSPLDLDRCASVCRAWCNASCDPSLWKILDVSEKELTAPCLMNIVRKQPECLTMDWTLIAKRQLAWLLVRLPQMRELSLQGSCNLAVSALRTCTCPPLTSLNLSFVTGFNDASLRYILSPPFDSRPGLLDSTSRLRHLQVLKLAGCNLSDVSLRYAVQSLPNLKSLDVSSCPRLTDAGVAQLGTQPAPTINGLISLDLSGCRLLTEKSLEYLSRCNSLERIDLRHISQISTKAVEKFAATRNELVVTDGKLIEKLCK